MTSYYRIYDLIKGQWLLCDLIEQILYGKVHTISRLNPQAKVFKMLVTQKSNTSTIKIDYIVLDNK